MMGMLELSALLGWLSAALLFAAGAAFFKLRRSPVLQRLTGRAGLKFDQFEGAYRLLLAAVGLSAVAAVLAVSGFMFG